MKLAANIPMNFRGMPIEDALAAAADLGFEAVDLFGTKDLDLPAVAKAVRKHNLVVSMVVGSKLQEGLNDPALHAGIEDSVRAAARDAREINGTNVVVLSGNTRKNVARSAQNKAIIDGLKRLAPIAEEHEVTVCLEMLNSRYDHPGYYLDDTELMVGLVRAVDHPRVKGLYDIYHAGIMRGNIIEDIRAGIDAIGHFHAAGIPGRNEPKGGEQNYPAICRAIDETGYDGHMGLEYSPLKASLESLRETKAWMEG